MGSVYGAVQSVYGSYPGIYQKGFPIQGLTPAVQNTLRLFIPSPAYCYSDTAGTTPVAKDGNVALWKEYSNKTSALQGTSGFQPKLRKGAKNLVINNTYVGGVAGTPGTTPTGWNINPAGGLSRELVGFGSEVIDGVLMPYMDVRFYGTITTQTGTFCDPVIGNLPAALGQVFCMSAWMKKIAGTLPTGLAMSVNERTAGGANNGNNFADLSTLSASTYTRIPVSKVITNPTSATVSFHIRYDPPSTGFSLDFTFRVAGAQVELGVSTPSQLVFTSGQSASNGVGNWWIDFDGTDDRLDISSPIIPGGSQGFTSGAFETNVAGVAGNAVVFSQCQTAITQPAWMQLLYSATSGPSTIGFWRNDANASISATSGTTIDKNVYTSLVDSTNSRVRKAGVVTNSVVIISPPITLDNACIGAFRRANSWDGFYKGALYGLAVLPGSFLTSDVLAVEKYLGRLAGVTI